MSEQKDLQEQMRAATWLWRVEKVAWAAGVASVVALIVGVVALVLVMVRT